MKKVFPAEFSDLLNKNGLKVMKNAGTEDHNDSIRIVSNIVRQEWIDKIFTTLDKQVYPHLKNFDTPIPQSWKKETVKNFSERLGKAMQFKSATLNSRNSTAISVANDTGLIDMLHSKSFRQFGEAMLSQKFGPKIGKQVICYETNNYVSPHTDYFPEYDHLKNGYYDMHLMFANSSVSHQWLIYEKDGHLNNIKDISSPSAVAAYHLPFWHYTTPLVPKQGKDKEARRWLILASFEKQ